MLKNFLKENNTRGWNLKSVILARDSKIIDEHYQSDRDCLNHQYSIAKAFTSAAIGILYDREQLSIDDYMYNYIDGINILSNDNTLKKVKIRHLLTNTTGNSKGYLFEADRHSYNNDDYLDIILNKPLEFEPGEHYAYSNSNYYLLSRIIESISGQVADDFIRDNIFNPLGITDYKSQRCSMNHFLGGSGFYMKTYDMIKLGIMLANYGEYNGNRLLSKKYIEKAFSPQFRLNSKESYGFSFMMKDSRCVFVAGNYNQLLLIDKTRNIVVAVNSDVNPSETGTLMKVVRRTIINASN